MRDARDRPAARGRVPLAPSFFQTFPKKCGSNAKLFQGMCWRFCGISMAYNRSKSKMMVSKLFRFRGEFEEAAEAVGSLRGHEHTLARVLFFRKKNRRPL
jgi:hypothetical protein